MDLKHPTTKISHHENETPPQSHPQAIKLLTFPNPNPKPHHHQSPRALHAATEYKQCLKNHAISVGGHALDGCGEYMPMPMPVLTAAEPASFKCAACGCHRNFHRREPTHDFPATRTGSLSPASPPDPEPTNYAFGQHLLLSLSRAADQNHVVATPGTPVAGKISGRKRFRTKFSQDQKEKMLAFAEKVGWKMQRCDDEKMVHDFCNEIGIRRRVLKVWMHNNRNTLAKKDDTTVAIASSGTTTVRSNDSHHQENGSSSSS